MAKEAHLWGKDGFLMPRRPVDVHTGGAPCLSCLLEGFTHVAATSNNRSNSPRDKGFPLPWNTFRKASLMGDGGPILSPSAVKSPHEALAIWGRLTSAVPGEMVGNIIAIGHRCRFSQLCKRSITWLLIWVILMGDEKDLLLDFGRTCGAPPYTAACPFCLHGCHFRKVKIIRVCLSHLGIQKKKQEGG